MTDKIPGKCPYCNGDLKNKERKSFTRFPGDLFFTTTIETFHRCKKCRFFFSNDYLRGYWEGWTDGTLGVSPTTFSSSSTTTSTEPPKATDENSDNR